MDNERIIGLIKKLGLTNEEELIAELQEKGYTEEVKGKILEAGKQAASEMEQALEATKELEKILKDANSEMKKVDEDTKAQINQVADEAENQIDAVEDDLEKLDKAADQAKKVDDDDQLAQARDALK